MRSLIKPKKQDNRKSSGGGGWGRQQRWSEAWTEFEKGGVGNMGGGGFIK